MSFEDKIKDFCSEIPHKCGNIETEETTKISLILPLLRLMGYDTTDPTEVQAEYTADIGNKQGEKVDFAILKDNKVEIIIECKPIQTTLEERHLNQLLRYYMTTEAQLGILTNGLIYQFYTDTNEDGKMDNTPFFEINLLNLNSKSIKRLEKFCKNNFDINQVSNNAKELKYDDGVKKVLLKEFEDPSKEFSRTIAKQVYGGLLTSQLNEKFSQIISNKINEIIDEKVNARLDKAIQLEKENQSNNDIFFEENNLDAPSTLEIEAFHIVRTICAETVKPERITLRNRKHYLKILLDDNQFYPILTLLFKDKSNLKIEFNGKWYKNKNNNRERKKEKMNIKKPMDISNYKNKILNSIDLFLNEQKQN